MSAFGFRAPNANDDDRLQKPLKNTVIWRPSQSEQQNAVLAFRASVLLARLLSVELLGSYALMMKQVSSSGLATYSGCTGITLEITDQYHHRRLALGT